MQIHNAVHVSLLKAFRGAPGTSAVFPTQLNKFDPLRSVDFAHAHRQRRSGKKVQTDFLVRYRDFPPEYDTWESNTDLQRVCPHVIQEYWVKSNFPKELR